MSRATPRLADQYETAPGGLSLHLYQGTIPLGRQTELVSRESDNGLYSIAVPSIELQAHGTIYALHMLHVLLYFLHLLYSFY